MKNPSWSRDELILALDVYFKIVPAVPNPKMPEIVALSSLLKSIPLEPGTERNSNFRSPDSIVMKLMNFRSFDPNYPGHGLKATGKGDKAVWGEFHKDIERLGDTADSIRAQISVLEKRSGYKSLPGEFAEAPEGRLLTRVHIERERNKTLVKRKKAKVLKDLGHLACEACGFDFEKTYGQRGYGFIEAHHTKPLFSMKPGDKTGLADLVLLCSNCHRMVHSEWPWLTLEELKQTLDR